MSIMYIILVNRQVLFELIEKLTLQAVLPLETSDSSMFMSKDPVLGQADLLAL